MSHSTLAAPSADAEIETLCSMFPDITAVHAHHLLKMADGDVAKAAGMHLDGNDPTILCGTQGCILQARHPGLCQIPIEPRRMKRKAPASSDPEPPAPAPRPPRKAEAELNTCKPSTMMVPRVRRAKCNDGGDHVHAIVETRPIAAMRSLDERTRLPDHWPPNVGYAPFLLWSSGDRETISVGDRIRLQVTCIAPLPSVRIQVLPGDHPCADAGERSYGLYAHRDLEVTKRALLRSLAKPVRIFARARRAQIGTSEPVVH